MLVSHLDIKRYPVFLFALLGLLTPVTRIMGPQVAAASREEASEWTSAAELNWT